MELIDRYVAAVGRRLPRDHRADVQEELSSTLRDALDRPGQPPATEADVVAMLKEFGHPDKVAASYYPSSQYLIGPELFPIFKRVTGIALAALLAVLTATFAVRLVLEPPDPLQLGDRLVALVELMFQAVATALCLIVLIFAGVQRLDVKPERSTKEWNPLDLPVVREEDLAGRAEAIAGIVAPAIVLDVLNAIVHDLAAGASPTWKPLLNRVLIENLPWLIAPQLLAILLHAALLIQGCWNWYTRIAKFAADGLGVYALYRVALALAVEQPALVAAGMPAPMARVLIQSAFWTVGVAAIVVAVEPAKLLYRSMARPDRARTRSREAADG